MASTGDSAESTLRRIQARFSSSFGHQQLFLARAARG